MKPKRGKFVIFSLMALMLSFIVFVMVSRFWIGSIERNFLEFLVSSKQEEPRRLSEILANFNIDDYECICILGPYQMTVDHKGKMGDAPDSIYEKINSNLKNMNYRRGFWGLLKSEAHWAIILFDRKNNLLRIDEVSSNRIPLVSLSGGRECFATKNIAVIKTRNSKYPYGDGLRFISNHK